MVLPRAVVPTFIAGLGTSSSQTPVCAHFIGYVMIFLSGGLSVVAVDSAVCELCLVELKNLHEKFPDFFRSSLLEGVRNMFLLVTKKGGFKVALSIHVYH
jgi:hypothetical protein